MIGCQNIFITYIHVIPCHPDALSPYVSTTWPLTGAGAVSWNRVSEHIHQIPSCNTLSPSHPIPIRVYHLTSHRHRRCAIRTMADCPFLTSYRKAQHTIHHTISDILSPFLTPFYTHHSEYPLLHLLSSLPSPNRRGQSLSPCRPHWHTHVTRRLVEDVWSTCQHIVNITHNHISQIMTPYIRIPYYDTLHTHHATVL